ncbi:MAG: hypothetical protein HKL80_04280 [Acidimicrobiales bacterium]|nr:hypothetical protein [Acidimicrobiales bacterium]
MADYISKFLTSIRVSDADHEAKLAKKAQKQAPMYFLTRREKSMGVAAGVYVLMFAAFIAYYGYHITLTQQEIKTYGKNALNISHQATIEQALFFVVVGLFILVAALFIKRRAPLFVACILGGLLLLPMVYSFPLLALGGWLIYKFTRIRKMNFLAPIEVFPDDAASKTIKSTSPAPMRQSPLDQVKKRRKDSPTTPAKILPQASKRYTPPKPVKTKKITGEVNNSK